MGAAVGVVDAGSGTGFACQMQAARVNIAVVGAADGDQVVGIVGAVGEGNDVMDVDVEGVAAARDLAAVRVALEDAAADRGGMARERDGLSRAPT
jgi:hypothetical protein